MNHSIKKVFACMVVFTILLSGCSNNSTVDKKTETKEEEKVELIKNSLYVEPKNPTTAQIKAFNKLSKAVEAQDEKKEAELAAVGFAFDFFTLSNKDSNEDVGGLSFVPTTMIFRFKEYAQAYYYSNYGTIKNDYGKEALPEVTSYKVKSVESVNQTYHGNPCSGYAVTMSLSYADTEVSKEKLKNEVTITMVSISDYPYDRAKTYKDNSEFTGERINAYRVLTLE